MIRPTDVERAPERSSRAIVLRRNPSWAAAAWTFAAVASATYCSPFMTREAVFRLTPDSAATWRSVGRLGTARSLASDIVILVLGRAAGARRGSAFRKHRLRTSAAREARANQGRQRCPTDARGRREEAQPPVASTGGCAIPSSRGGA